MTGTNSQACCFITLKGIIEVQNMLRCHLISVPNDFHNLLSETLQRNSTSAFIPALKCLKHRQRETGSKCLAINSATLFPFPFSD